MAPVQLRFTYHTLDIPLTDFGPLRVSTAAWLPKAIYYLPAHLDRAAIVTTRQSVPECLTTQNLFVVNAPATKFDSNSASTYARPSMCPSKTIC